MPSDKWTNDPYAGLSPLDREILRSLGRGMDVAAIARQLGLSAEALTDRCDEVCGKLGLRSREELRIWALRRIAVVGQVATSARQTGQLLLPFGSDKGAE